MARLECISHQHPFGFAKRDELTISLQVNKYRKAANVPYPNAYCSHDEASKDFKKKQFNCAQRAHVCLSPLLKCYPTLAYPCELCLVQLPGDISDLLGAFGNGRDSISNH